MEATWTLLSVPGAPAPHPGPRSSHGVSALPDGTVLVLGGEREARDPAGMDLWQLKPTEGGWRGAAGGALACAWEKLTPAAGSPVPPPRNAHAQAAAGGRLWVVGGRSGVGVDEGMLGDVWAWDQAARAWSGPLTTTGEAAPPRSYAAACGTKEAIFVFGGCGASGRLADLYKLDVATMVWERLPDPPGVDGRGGATLEASTCEGKLLLYSGFIGKETRDVLTLDLATKEWTRSHGPECDSSCPCACAAERSVAQSCTLSPPGVHSGAVAVFGGEVAPSAKGHSGAGSFAGDVLLFGCADGQRLECSAVVGAGEKGCPEPRGWGAMTAVSPTMGVLFGGLAGDDVNPRRLDDAWLLQLAPHAHSAGVCAHVHSPACVLEKTESDKSLPESEG